MTEDSDTAAVTKCFELLDPVSSEVTAHPEVGGTAAAAASLEGAAGPRLVMHPLRVLRNGAPPEQ